MGGDGFSAKLLYKRPDCLIGEYLHYTLDCPDSLNKYYSQLITL